MAVAKRVIASVRFQHPTEDREVEVRFESGQCKEVDAVFTSVDVVNKILIPYYEKVSPKTVEELKKQVQEQQLNNVCFVFHQKPCSRHVPPINWGDPAPIIL